MCQQLCIRPLSLRDTEYGCGAFLLATADIQADKLMRLRTNLVLDGPQSHTEGVGSSKTRVKFRFQYPNTWWLPDQVFSETGAEFGFVTIKIWDGLRFANALDCRLQVACIEHDQAPGTRRKPKLVWFGWVGQAPPQQ